MAIYSFNTVLLSAQKTGNPFLMGTSITGPGVTTVSLSTMDVGIAYNTITPLLASTISCNVAGSVFTIDRAYDNKPMAIVKTSGAHSTFIFLSAVTTVPLGNISTSDGVSTPNTRRLRHLGY